MYFTWNKKRLLLKEMLLATAGNISQLSNVTYFPVTICLADTERNK